MRLRSTKVKPDRSPPNCTSLIHSHPAPLLRRTKRDYDNHPTNHRLAFSYLRPSSNEEEPPCAGMSSAASIITLNLPRQPAILSKTSEKQPQPASLSSSSRKKKKKSRGTNGKYVSQSSHRDDSIETILSRHLDASRPNNHHRFKPIYTHQFFAEERMRGYRPSAAGLSHVLRLLSSSSTNTTTSKDDGTNFNNVNLVPHESFAYHAVSRYELSIQVKLSPSCRKSFVFVTVGKVENTTATSSTATSSTSTANNSNVSKNKITGKALDMDSEIIEISDDDCGMIAVEQSKEEVTKSGGNSRKRRGGGVDARPLNRGNKSRRILSDPSTTTSSSTRRSNRRRIDAVLSSDESEEDRGMFQKATRPMIDAVAVRRSGRTCVPSKRCLFSIDESDDEVDSSKAPTKGDRGGVTTPRNCSDNSSSSSVKSRPPQNSNRVSHPSPALTRSMSIQSNDSMCTYTGDICLDGGKMKVETIVKHLSRGLPHVEGVLLHDGTSYTVVGVGGDDNDNNNSNSLESTIKTMQGVEEDYLHRTIGDQYPVLAYTARKRPMRLRDSGGIETTDCDEMEDASFSIHVAHMSVDEEARKYHDQVEKLAPWWIETADCVHMGLTGGISDKGDGDKGHWKVLYLFEQHKKIHIGPKRPGKLSRIEMEKRTPKYSLAGYMTVLIHPKKTVVCQVLILPPYQRSGHGTKLMQAVYRMSTSQIDVELPGRAFVSLRDKIDYGLYLNLPKEHSQHVKISSKGKVFLAPLPEDLVQVLSKFITSRQVQVAYEVWLLGEIDEYIESRLKTLSNVKELNKHIACLETKYKSIVKKSLLQVMHIKDEKFCSLSVEDQKEKLEDCFISTLAHYRTILPTKSQLAS